MFIGREAELAQLEALYASGHAELFILYGRRRVGKTELLRAFCTNKPHIFFIATLSSDHDQLAALSQDVYQLLHAEVSDGFSYPSWEAALHALAELPGRPVIVLDEFTYLQGDAWVNGMCGHLYSISMDDGSVLTTYGNYLAGGILIRWKP